MAKKQYNMTSDEVVEQTETETTVEQSAKLTPEMKRANFKRLAESRTEKALHAIDLLGNLSNRSAYVYNEKDIDAIFNALHNQIEATKATFIRMPDAEKSKFTLED